MELAKKVGFRVEFMFSSWDMKVFKESSTFLVAVLNLELEKEVERDEVNDFLRNVSAQPWTRPG